MDFGRPTLDQLRIFLAVCDEGSFNAAARKLGRAVSVISYGIATLEAQFALKLFDREGSRRPEITDAGRALVPAARAVIGETDHLMAQVRSINAGVETRISLALDVMAPFDIVAEILRDFQLAFPLVALRLHVEALGAVAALVREGHVDLAIAGPEILDLPELNRKEVGCVELVPVAAPSHPLAQMAAIEPGRAGHYLQLVLTDRSDYTKGREFSVLSSRTWRLADFSARRDLLISGIGWGYLPRHSVRGDIAAGRLVILSLPEGVCVDYRLHALWPKGCLPGPATTWLMDALETAF